MAEGLPGGPAATEPIEASVVLRRGTALDTDPSRLSVLTYNLLAPLYVRSVDSRTGGVQKFAAFEWAEPSSEVLDWEARRPRLLSELRAARADVLCLQEVQFEASAPEDGTAAAERHRLPAWLRGLCEEAGYTACLPSQDALAHMAERNLRVLGREAAVGTALMYRHDRLEALPDGAAEKTTQVVGACLRGRPRGALAHLVPTAVFSVHLDAKDEEQRVQQLRRCMALARQAGVRELVVAGDMNSECLPGSCVGALVAPSPEPSRQELARACAAALQVQRLSAEGQDGHAAGASEPSEEQLGEWAELRRWAASAVQEFRIPLSHVRTGPTRAGYDHGKSCGPCVSWRLDHIFYTSRSLRLRASWDALDGDPESAAAGLPNRACPSDHLPVAAAFAPGPAPRLPAERRGELLRRLEELQRSHEAELAASAARPEPAPPGATEEENQPPRKKERKKKERASPEEQAAVQDRRRRLRELRERHAGERGSFWEALGELEQDALEAEDLCGPEWVQTGSRRPRVWTLRARARLAAKAGGQLPECARGAKRPAPPP